MEFQPETKNISSVQFSIMSPDEIRSRSVVEITKYETYDKDVPVVKGLFDIRMGSTEMGRICQTCGQKNIDCPGHFGHLELAKPVYHYHLIDQIPKILKCVCFNCSKLLIDKENNLVKNILKKNPKARFNELYELCSKVKRCGENNIDGCGCKQPDRYKVSNIEGIQARWTKLEINENNSSDIKTQLLKVEHVKSILEKITDEDAEYMGFSRMWCRPEWLICSVLPIPPPAVRPSVKQDNSQRMEDDLTHKLFDIIKVNNTIRDKLNNDLNADVDIYTMNLQYHIATLINNELSGGINQAAHRSGRPLKAITQRLKGKEGRIRNNLMGKRVDFSARSVITPDPNIDLDQLGVPEKIANNLTYPEKVNNINYNKLNQLLEKGYNIWPGIKSIIKKDSKMVITLNENNVKNIELEIGDIVNRNIMDGDYVLFNRQPSLHKMSMMAHRIKVMKGNTFRLNVSVTPPYNADFDGDEMNMHVPQSITSVCELKNLVSVKYQIVSPRENKPIITIVQDTLLGINKLTKSEKINYIGDSYNGVYYNENTNIYEVQETNKNNTMVDETSYFNKTQMMNIICNLSTFNGIPPDSTKTISVNGNDIELWSGKTILSYILPKNLNLEFNNSSYDNNIDDPYNEKLNKIIIKNGKLIQGSLDKNVFTKTSKGLIHTIYNDYGHERATEFINDLQKIVTHFLLIEGFSVGIGDIIASEGINQEINNTIQENKKKINELMQEIHLNVFENYSGQSNSMYFESKVNSILNELLNKTGKTGLRELDQKNRAVNMVNSGSKGKITNIGQMVACLGQQNVDGKRIPNGFNDRTLPHYYKYDDSSEARGFVENSFISGQSPQEFFFHAMGGREGLIDTACKTAATGYIQRKLVKSQEDLYVNYDLSVRNSAGCIYQFIYGDDGMEGINIESQSLLINKLDTKGLCKKFLLDENTEWNSLMEQNIIDDMKKDKKYQDKLNESFINILEHKQYLYEINKTLENNILYPIDINRLCKNKCLQKEPVKSNISPLYILDHNDKLKNKLYITDTFKNNKIIHILIDIHLSPKLLMTEFNIQREEYDEIVLDIEYLFEKSKVSPGEMVGVLGAQSIGEPATQMTLNTFHFAGVSAKSNVTRGIPRLTELLHLSKSIKSPSTIIFLKDEFNSDRNKTQYVKNKLEYIGLKDIIKNNQIYFDPKNHLFETVIDEDKEMLSVYNEFNRLQHGDVDFEETAPFIIRFVFDKIMMLENNITMDDIYLAIMKFYNVDKKINYYFSDDNSKELIGRISIVSDMDGQQQENGLYDQSDVITVFKNIMNDLLDNVVIKGIENIENLVIPEHKTIVKENGEYIDKKEHILQSDGINLLEVFNSKYVDFTRTHSNDVNEIYEKLGIEAARNILISEISSVCDDAGEYINSRHIELLVDVMTNKGYLTAINRQGIGRGDVGPLAKSSFEDTTDQFIKASMFGEKDKLKGVSSNIMMGQTIKAGTGLTELLLDENKLIQSFTELNYNENEYIENIDENIHTLLNDGDVLEDEYCNDDNFEFSV
jgi:DNA-directed RNA polymerase II subunit RPB1